MSLSIKKLASRTGVALAALLAASGVTARPASADQLDDQCKAQLLSILDNNVKDIRTIISRGQETPAQLRNDNGWIQTLTLTAKALRVNTKIDYSTGVDIKTKILPQGLLQGSGLQQNCVAKAYAWLGNLVVDGRTIPDPSLPPFPAGLLPARPYIPVPVGPQGQSAATSPSATMPTPPFSGYATGSGQPCRFLLGHPGCQ